VLSFQDYLLLGATTVLECQWAQFYATGSALPIRRILSMGRHWAAQGEGLPDSVNYIVSLTAKLPAEVTVASTDPVEAAASVKTQVSRIALWSLLRQSRRHQGASLLQEAREAFFISTPP
jgi:hypothetical protein